MKNFAGPRCPRLLRPRARKWTAQSALARRRRVGRWDPRRGRALCSKRRSHKREGRALRTGPGSRRRGPRNGRGGAAMVASQSAWSIGGSVASAVAWRPMLGVLAVLGLPADQIRCALTRAVSRKRAPARRRHSRSGLVLRVLIRPLVSVGAARLRRRADRQVKLAGGGGGKTSPAGVTGGDVRERRAIRGCGPAQSV